MMKKPESYIIPGGMKRKRKRLGDLIAFYGSCVLCNSKHKLCEHHRHYDSEPGKEDMQRDTTLLCGRCHRRFHFQEGQVNEQALNEIKGLPIEGKTPEELENEARLRRQRRNDWRRTLD